MKVHGLCKHQLGSKSITDLSGGGAQAFQQGGSCIDCSDLRGGRDSASMVNAPPSCHGATVLRRSQKPRPLYQHSQLIKRSIGLAPHTFEDGYDKKRWTVASAGEAVERLEPYTAGRIVQWCSHFGKNRPAVPQKVKHSHQVTRPFHS